MILSLPKEATKWCFKIDKVLVPQQLVHDTSTKMTGRECADKVA